MAEGGMAEVWLATAHGESGFTRRVAVKLMFQHEGDGAFARMFLDEARITSRLHHPNIVDIVDFGVEAERPFQVLEWVDGYDAARLASWGREQGRALSVELALWLCEEVARGLHFAHTATGEDGAPLRVVHRDVSPQNVLVSRQGEVKLSDFGIALAATRTEKTVGAMTRGKPAYMAPEQAIRGALDARADVFSLGCVLHGLVTGESALRDENAMVDLLAGMELSLSPRLPPVVKEVVARATRRNKAERFETADAFGQACAAARAALGGANDPRRELATWVHSLAPKEVSVATSPRVVTAPKRRSVAPVALGASVLIMGLGAWALRPDQPATPPMKPVAEKAETIDLPRAPEPVAAEPEVVNVTPPPKPTVRPKVDAGVRVAPSEPPRFGTVRVGGEALLRGEVFVDGASRGFAPLQLELSVGRHHLEVRGADGQSHTRDVTVEVLHSVSSPLSWTE